MNRHKKTLSFGDAQKLSSPKAFSTLVKPVGSNCNMRCSYCYYLDKGVVTYDNALGAEVMSDALLKEYIAQYIEANDVEVVTFCWHGGEPLLAGLPFYEKAMKYQRRYAKDKKIENNIQTNGLLINDEWCRFFKSNNFLVGISIDGPEDVHDAYRVNVGGGVTFKKVMGAIERMARHGVEFNTLSVVNDKCAGRGVEIYNFFKSIGSRYMQFLPAVEYVSQESIALLGGRGRILSPYEGGGAVSSWSTSAVDYGRFLCDIFDVWVKEDVGTYFVQMFDVALASWYGVKPGLCAFNKSCGDGLVVEHNGDVYSCDHFVYPEHKLGNISEQELALLSGSKKQFLFGLNKKNGLPESCHRCKYYFACTGGCPKHRFGSTESEPKASYLCEGYKMFFTHVAPYMDIMSDLLRKNRSAAEIMNHNIVTRGV